MSVWLIVAIVSFVLFFGAAVASDGVEAVLFGVCAFLTPAGIGVWYVLFVAGSAVVHHPVQAAHSAGQVVGAFAKGAADAP